MKLEANLKSQITQDLKTDLKTDLLVTNALQSTTGSCELQQQRAG